MFETWYAHSQNTQTPGSLQRTHLVMSHATRLCFGASAGVSCILLVHFTRRPSASVFTHPATPSYPWMASMLSSGFDESQHMHTVGLLNTCISLAVRTEEPRSSAVVGRECRYRHALASGGLRAPSSTVRVACGYVVARAHEPELHSAGVVPTAVAVVSSMCTLRHTTR